jgi:hypothetical protein
LQGWTNEKTFGDIGIAQRCATLTVTIERACLLGGDDAYLGAVAEPCRKIRRVVPRQPKLPHVGHSKPGDNIAEEGSVTCLDCLFAQRIFGPIRQSRVTPSEARGLCLNQTQCSTSQRFRASLGMTLRVQIGSELSFQ